jgi:hypothetical protein
VRSGGAQKRPAMQPTVSLSQRLPGPGGGRKGRPGELCQIVGNPRRCFPLNLGARRIAGLYFTSIVTFSIERGSLVAPDWLPAASSFFSVSIPSVTLPKMVCLSFSHGVGTNVRKN